MPLDAATLKIDIIRELGDVGIPASADADAISAVGKLAEAIANAVVLEIARGTVTCVGVGVAPGSPLTVTGIIS